MPPEEDLKDKLIEDLAEVIHNAEADSSGSNPTPFQNTPRSMRKTDRLDANSHCQRMAKAFSKEITGTLINEQSCSIADANPEDTMAPIMDVHKCKLGEAGLIDKLKCRVAFWEDW